MHTQTMYYVDIHVPSIHCGHDHTDPLLPFQLTSLLFDPCIHPLTHPLISSNHPFTHSPIHPFVHSFVHPPFIRSFVHPFIHSRCHGFANSCRYVGIDPGSEVNYGDWKRSPVTGLMSRGAPMIQSIGAWYKDSDPALSG
jgi:hypothetical protein